LFDCVDKAALQEGANDFMVTCRIVSTFTALSSVAVGVFSADRNFTIEPAMPDIATDYPYQDDPSYIVRVEPKPTTVSI